MSSRIPKQLLYLSILVSIVNFSLQSCDLLQDGIHIAVNSLDKIHIAVNSLSLNGKSRKTYDLPPLPRIPRIPSCERSVRADRFPGTQFSSRKDGVNSAERPVDQIHNFLVWRAVQRESLNRMRRDKRSKQGKKGRTGSEECDCLCWEAKREVAKTTNEKTTRRLQSCFPVFVISQC